MDKCECETATNRLRVPDKSHRQQIFCALLVATAGQLPVASCQLQMLPLVWGNTLGIMMCSCSSSSSSSLLRLPTNNCQLRATRGGPLAEGGGGRQINLHWVANHFTAGDSQLVLIFFLLLLFLHTLAAEHFNLITNCVTSGCYRVAGKAKNFFEYLLDFFGTCSILKYLVYKLL